MKMRKILSFVLVLSLVLGSFSMAFAATPSTGLSDIAGIANEDAIQVNNDLGIIKGFPDGTFKPEQLVNRAEFAAMITRALAIPESALAGYTSTTFKDTAGYGWAVPYLAFAQSKGIMIGDGMGNAMPGRTINVNEAMTMVLRAIGYVNHSSVLVGNWPSNYVTVAQNVGLYDDIASSLNVDRANAAQIIYNALTVQKVSVNADGATTFLTIGNNPPVAATLLNTGLKCEPVKGVMGIDFGSDSVMNVQRFVGQFGTAYVNSDDKVVAFKAESTQLVGKYVSGSDDFDDNFKTLSGDTYTNTMTTTTGIATMKNGVEDTTLVQDDDTVYTVNAKVSGSRITQVYSVMLWDVTADDVVSASDLKAIEDDQSLLGIDFTLDDDDEIDMKSFALVGVKSLSDIKADNVVYVYATNSEITRIEVGTKTVDGLVQSFKDNKATIAGTAYKNAEKNVNGLDNYDSITDETVSYNVSASLDVNGYVYTFEVTDDVANNVAVLLATGGGVSYQAKLKIADDSSKVYTVKNKSVFDELRATEGLLVYGLNSSGEISSVTDGGTTVVLNVGSTFDSNRVVKNNGGNSYRISSDVVVFEKKASADYKVISISDVTKATATTVNGELLLDDKNVVIGIIVASADARATADDTYGVINKRFFATNADGDRVIKLVGFADGVAFDKFTDSAANFLAPAWNGNTFTTLGGVQLYKMEIDSKGVITAGTTTYDGDAPLVSDAAIDAVDGRAAVQVGGTWYALADDVVIYEFIPADDEYKVFTGRLLKDWKVTIYELDDDNNGAEVVFFIR
jgi:hypothetical protein